MNIADTIAVFRCPYCAGKGHGQLTNVKANWLACACGRQYPIVEGIPVLLPDEGEKWFKLPVAELPDIQEHNRFMNDGNGCSGSSL